MLGYRLAEKTGVEALLRREENCPRNLIYITSVVAGVEKPGATGGRCLGGGGQHFNYQSKESLLFGQQLSGHKFSEIYYPSAFRLFVSPLKNLAEKEDMPFARFPVTSVVAGVKNQGRREGAVWGGGGNSSIIKARNPFFWSTAKWSCIFGNLLPHSF
jgi:hypothetical protein